MYIIYDPGFAPQPHPPQRVRVTCLLCLALPASPFPVAMWCLPSFIVTTTMKIHWELVMAPIISIIIPSHHHQDLHHIHCHVGSSHWVGNCALNPHLVHCSLSFSGLDCPARSCQATARVTESITSKARSDNIIGHLSKYLSFT